MAVDEVPMDTGISHWKHTVDRMVRSGEVSSGWRDFVVHLAATGKEQEAFDQVRDSLIQSGDPYTFGVESGQAPTWMSDSREPGIHAWLHEQVEEHRAKAEAGKSMEKTATVALDATPPLTHASRLEGSSGARPTANSPANGTMRSSTDRDRRTR